MLWLQHFKQTVGCSLVSTALQLSHPLLPPSMHDPSYDVPQVDKVYFCSAIDKYITCARDGTFRLWQASDLAYVKTVNNSSSWVTDCLYLPYSRKMVFTTMDRAITYYDVTRCVRVCVCECDPVCAAAQASCMCAAAANSAQ